MKSRFGIVLLISALLVCPCAAFGDSSPDINSSWKFCLLADGTGSADDIDDSSWPQVTLPFDAAVSCPSSAVENTGSRTVCYRRHFVLPLSDKGRSFNLYVERISDNYELFCNGFQVGSSSRGYVPASFDLTDYLKFGEENVLTFICRGSVSDRRYYDGIGIVRPLSLFEDPQVHLAPLFGVRPRVFVADDLKSASVAVSATVVNSGITSGGPYELRQIVRDASGNIVAKDSRTFRISPMKSLDIKISLNVPAPRLWSPEHPNLYKLTTTIVPIGGAPICTRETAIGFRKTVFTPDGGLKLNGSHYELRGATIHDNCPAFGAAVPEGIWRYRLEKLKEFGFNAIRIVGSPAPQLLLDLCDSIGLAVIDESRDCGTSTSDLESVESMVYSHMAHPSIVLWSLGNELVELENLPSGADIAARLGARIAWLDPTREVTCANAGGPYMLSGISVLGFSHIDQNAVEQICQSMPGKASLLTAETSGAATRGVYGNIPEKKRFMSLNRSGVQPDFCSYSDADFEVSNENMVLNVIERGWQFFRKHPFLSGIFYESAFDYIGISTSDDAALSVAQSGIFDACGFPKDEAWYLRSVWKKTPMVYMSPHMSLSEDGVLPLLIYSNCDEVELISGGTSLGRRSMPVDGHLSWSIQADTCSFLALVGYDNMKKTSSLVMKDCGAAKYALWKVKSYEDLSVIDITVVDDADNPVPDSEALLSVKLPQGWQVMSCGNGDPVNLPCNGGTSDGSRFAAFGSKAQVVVRPPVPGGRLSEEQVLVVVE